MRRAEGLDAAPGRADLELEGEEPGRVHLPSPEASGVETIVEACAPGSALVELPGQPEYRELAALRDALWPRGHIVAIYRLDADGHVARVTVGGKQVLDARLPGDARTVLYVRNLELALGQSTTRAKFDANAEGCGVVIGAQHTLFVQQYHGLVLGSVQALQGRLVKAEAQPQAQGEQRRATGHHSPLLRPRTSNMS